MKFQLPTVLVGLAATTVSAQQNQNQTGPFSLLITGSKANTTLNGSLSNCHTGAGISALCYSSAQASAQYYFNYTGFDKAGEDEVGTLTWNLPFIDDNGNPATISQPMSLEYQTTSNVAAPMFGLSDNTFSVGFDSEGVLFGYNYIDDSKFVPGMQPPVTQLVGRAYYQWAVCWQYFAGYYYQSLAWVQSGISHNPTCEAVMVTQKA
ncbi:hypothetical protein GGR50DRAFT_615469 [Xylaria sp. CBS 124048]|nr:hypothetical protein GGR50DRAFT_615469 [Xylaria sp. CBS 124048]